MGLVRPICRVCEIRQGALKERNRKGDPIYRNICDPCRKTDYGRYKGTSCEICEFEAVHSAQLDVDHIDGNHSNNHPDNLQTLCANCHRLKTMMNRDWETRDE